MSDAPEFQNWGTRAEFNPGGTLTLQDLAKFAAKHGYAVVPERKNAALTNALAENTDLSISWQFYDKLIAAGRIKND